MDPERMAAIAAKNAEEVERGRRAARNPPGLWQDVGDAAATIDVLGDAVGLAIRAGGLAWDATCAVGKGAGAVCDAVGRVLPD